MRACFLIPFASMFLMACGGPKCISGQTVCGGTCAVLADDPYNCGACGSVCGGGNVCTQGVCAPAFPHLGLPGGAVPGGAPIYRIQPGGSTTVQPGTQAGYGITANLGGSYRLVWTGDAQQSGTYREFWGSVYTAGNFSNVVAGCASGLCALQSNDTVTAPQPTAGGSRIDFDSIAADALNGFDFVTDTEPVYFDVYIDGAHYPNLIFYPATDLGGQTANAGAIPFGLTTN